MAELFHVRSLYIGGIAIPPETRNLDRCITLNLLVNKKYDFFSVLRPAVLIFYVNTIEYTR